MMNAISIILSALALVMPPKWPASSRDAKPWVYNWWLGSAVDRDGLEEQCSKLEEAGFGGFHVIPIYQARGWEGKSRSYLSPSWMAAFADAVKIGGLHGLGVDMSMGSGWCFGGPQLNPGQGCWRIRRTPDGQQPYVTWELTGQCVKRAGPGGRGPMMDPYSTEAMEAFLRPFAAFDRPGTPRPAHVFHDSWEYYYAGWTPTFFEAFRTKRGYDLRGHLRELSGRGTSEEVGKVRLDYRETLSDLVIDDVFPKWVEWAHARGIGVRIEGHGTGANWLDFYALADIPETEMFAAECRDILISKFASSAAHVSGKKLVSSESCTWLSEHFTETLADFKVFIDRLFLSGVNHMYYHGCCYSPVDAVWPGWCFYAAAEMNPRNPIWRDVGMLNAYITRVQSMFQACEPDNDTLVYWPLRDYWWKAGGFECPMSVHNAKEWFHMQPIGTLARKLYAEGCSFDYVSDRQLQKLDLSRYSRIVVPPCRHMPEATQRAISSFRERPVRLEPFSAAGLPFVRFRHGADAVYFVVNTNAVRVTRALLPSADGAAWFMDPMTGCISSAPRHPDGFHLELEAGASTFLTVRPSAPPYPATGEKAPRSDIRTLDGPWKLEPVCGGPALPPVRIMDRLSTWSRNQDGSENPFSGTMRYTTTFEWKDTVTDLVIDLGRVCESARVSVNGKEIGFAIMAPYRIAIGRSALKEGRNTLSVEVTSVGANRIRWNDRTGVRWKYFEDANVTKYGYGGQLDASQWPLRDCGLLGPVVLKGRRKADQRQ